MCGGRGVAWDEGGRCRGRCGLDVIMGDGDGVNDSWSETPAAVAIAAAAAVTPAVWFGWPSVVRAGTGAYFPSGSRFDGRIREFIFSMAA